MKFQYAHSPNFTKSCALFCAICTKQSGFVIFFVFNALKNPGNDDVTEVLFFSVSDEVHSECGEAREPYGCRAYQGIPRTMP